MKKARAVRDWLKHHLFNKYWVVEHLPIPRDWKLAWDYALMERQYSRELKAARSKGDDAAIEKLQFDWHVELSLVEEEQALRFSQGLLRRARKLRVPTPSHYLPGTNQLNEDYELSPTTEHIVLTTTGAQKVRLAIREEEKWRSDAWTRRIPWVTGVTGLLGTATGLVAAWQKWGTGP